jgi:hypothetical protein
MDTVSIRNGECWMEDWLLIHLTTINVAFAAGFLLALACDFRIMTDGRAWACMNEVRLCKTPYRQGYGCITTK